MSYLSQQIRDGAKKVEASRLVGGKAWIDDVHQQVAPRLNLDTFKTLVANDPDCRMQLCRADMGHLTPSKTAAAEAHYLRNVTFHFVRLA